ncbi:ABC transporter permease [Arthrobacter sp. NEB 688]|uniref:ABC transporter permease n=1 Tax=Arthrobacter sp. NEB 688 TaxID=904039 RepID=UPI0015636AB9|nr:ABC transporter permease [Arthrobacter sp. NEB 688]QKE83646.1 ABC transporter permease [Arthrobacter sp. NEB 688]
MSTATRAPEAPTVPASASAPRGGRPGVPLARLLRVELRKLVDTRAGRWLLGVTAGLAVAVVAALLVWGSAKDSSYVGLLGLAALPLSVLLPILGIMAATAEWSQRTGLVTFALEPHRGRVVAAKALASVVLGVAVVLVTAAAVALARLVGSLVRGGDTVWSVPAATGGGLALALVLFLVQGVGFGLLFLNTPLAIVASFALPTALSIVAGLAEGAQRVTAWLDLSLVTEPLMTGTMRGEDWAHLATSALVWVALPVAVGTWRVTRKEIA